jgi:hypothetical protein
VGIILPRWRVQEIGFWSIGEWHAQARGREAVFRVKPERCGWKLNISDIM